MLTSAINALENTIEKALQSKIEGRQFQSNEEARAWLTTQGCEHKFSPCRELARMNRLPDWVLDRVRPTEGQQSPTLADTLAGSDGAVIDYCTRVGLLSPSDAKKVVEIAERGRIKLTRAQTDSRGLE